MSQKSTTGETVLRTRWLVLQKGVVNVGPDDVHLGIIADEIHFLDFRLIFASSDLVRHHFGVLKGNFVRFADQGRVLQIVAAQFLSAREKESETMPFGKIFSSFRHTWYSASRHVRNAPWPKRGKSA